MINRLPRVFKSDIEKRICKVEDRLREYLKSQDLSKLTICHFGAIDIDPKHLVICIGVGTDEEVDKFDLYSVIKLVHTWFEEEKYPSDSIKQIGVRIDSQETVDRDFYGNWFYCYK